MSFLETLLSGNTAKERKKKQICAIVIAATAFLLAISIIAFAICQVVDATMHLTSNKEKDDTETEAPVDLGETTTIQLSEEQIYSGNLLTLNSTTRYNNKVDVINIQNSEDRPKTEAGKNSYTASFKGTYYATVETTTALNKMLKDFYAAKKDDNIFISGAYNADAVDTQDAIFSSGEAIALSYFHDFATTQSTADQRSIQGVETYKWIYTNCYKYGFVPVSSSSNVFRYIGNTTEAQAHALAAKNMGSLDKYLNELKKATVDNPMAVNAEGTIIAYTCPINDVKVPKNHSYKISGNNSNGVIVTVTLTKSTSNNIE